MFEPFTPGSGNNPPVTIGPIPNQTTNTNILFSFTPNVATVFNDPEGDPLVYSATLAGGAPLPAWLSFNPTTQEFSGTPTAIDAGTITIELSASDGGGIATQTFALTVIDPPQPPVVVNPLPDVLRPESAIQNSLRRICVTHCHLAVFSIIKRSGDGILNLLNNLGGAEQQPATNSSPE